MKAKNILVFLFASLVLVLATAPIQAQIVTVNNVNGIASVSGQLARISPPASVEQGEVEDDDRAFIFLERENFRLREILRVNVRGTGTIDSSGEVSGGSIASGTEVNSYFIHYDRTGQPATLSGVSGSVTFEQDILGLILLTNDINRSTDEFRAVRTLYGNGHGLEFSSQAQLSQDSVTISSNRRTLSFSFENNVQTDQIRVITLETGDTGDGGSDGGGNGSGNGGGSTGDCNNPTATNDSVTTDRNESVVIDVLDNDDDSNNNTDDCTITIDSNPTDGTVTVNNSNDTITYDPDSGFTGTDRFDYEICDDDDDCSRATVTVTVRSGSSGGGSGGDGDGGSQVTLRTLLPEADDCSREEEARIDIVPGNRENFIRLDDEDGYTPVAILSSEDFPAPNCIDVSTITFGPTGDEEAALSCGVVNVNFDRWKDIVCDFNTSSLGFEVGDEEGVLEADVVDGGFIDPTDDVMVIDVRRIKNFTPPKRPGEPAIKSVQIGQNLFVKAQSMSSARMEIQVFSTQGIEIYHDKTNGSLLRWNMRSANGQRLANGVYFYLVTNYDSEGNVIGRTLNKIAIVR